MPSHIRHSRLALALLSGLGLPALAQAQPAIPLPEGSVLRARSDAEIGPPGARLSFRGGTLAALAGFTSPRAMALDGPGTIAVAPDQGLTLSGVISGPGPLTLAGPGFVTLTGANTFSGPVRLESGGLRIGDGGGSGRLSGEGILLGAGTQLAFNRNDATTYAGEITGAGAVRIVSGGMTLTGSSSYTGGTTIDPGAGLRLGCGCGTGQILGNVLNNGELGFDRGDNSRFAGQISGSGFVQILSGGVTFTGTNSYSGGTSISEGAGLRIGDGGTTGSLPGDVRNNGVLAFNRSDAITVRGLISGSGDVQVLSGEVTLEGWQAYTGLTSVGAAVLRVNGTLAEAGALNVLAGGLVTGSGTLPRTAIGNGGTIAPGNGIGTLRVAGDLVFQPRAMALMEVGASTADRIEVSRRALLDGTLRLVHLGTGFGFNTTRTLIAAGEGRFGQFSRVEASFGPGVNYAVTYSGQEVRLTLTPHPLLPGPVPMPPAQPGEVVVTPAANPNGALPSGAIPANIRGAAAALDVAARAGGDLSGLFNVYNQPAANLPMAINQLSGEVATTSIGLGLLAGEQFMATLLDPLGYGRESLLGGRLRQPSGDGDAPAARNTKRHAVWGAAIGAVNRTQGGAASGAATRHANSAGFVLGWDMLLGRESMAGIAIAAGGGSASLSGGQGSATSNLGQVGLHGSTRLGSVTLAAAAALTWMEVDSKRTLYFLDNSVLRGNAANQVTSGRLEARQDGLAWGGARWQPFAALQVQAVRNGGFTESAGNAAALNVAGGTNTTLRTELGFQAQGSWSLGGQGITAFGRLAWGYYAMREQSLQMGFAALNAPGFTVLGARPDANAALVSAGVESELRPGLALGARLDGEFSGQVQQLAGTARLRYLF